MDVATAAERLDELNADLVDLVGQLHTKTEIERNAKKKHYEAIAAEYTSSSALTQEVLMRTTGLFIETHRIQSKLDATRAEIDHLRFCIEHSLLEYLDAGRS